MLDVYIRWGDVVMKVTAGGDAVMAQQRGGVD